MLSMYMVSHILEYMPHYAKCFDAELTEITEQNTIFNQKRIIILSILVKQFDLLNLLSLLLFLIP